MYSFPLQFFSPLSKIKDEPQKDHLQMMDNEKNQRCVLVHFGLVMFLSCVKVHDQEGHCLYFFCQ